MTASATFLSNEKIASNVVKPFPVGKPSILKTAIALSMLAPTVVVTGSNLKLITGAVLPLLNVKLGSVLLVELIPNKTDVVFNIPVISVLTRLNVNVPAPDAFPLTRILKKIELVSSLCGLNVK